MFLWRCMSNAIPMRLNLFRRKITASPICGLCDQYEESIKHALFLCPRALYSPHCQLVLGWNLNFLQAVWFGSPMTLRIDTQSFSTLDVWLNNILDLRTESKMEKHDLLTMLSFFLWEVWKTRCKAIMEGYRIDPCKVVENAVVEFLGGLAASRVGHSALEVEAEAAVMGLEFAPNLSYSDVYVESDSKTLVDGIKGDIRNCAWTIRPSIEVIWRRADQFISVFWCWVQRSSNRAAHEAAAIGCRAVELESWVTQPPLSLIHVLVSDCLSGPP
ncbi:unnamed protein product [Prunus brigantina]